MGSAWGNAAGLASVPAEIRVWCAVRTPDLYFSGQSCMSLRHTREPRTFWLGTARRAPTENHVIRRGTACGARIRPLTNFSKQFLMAFGPPVNHENVAPPPSAAHKPETWGRVSHIISKTFQNRSLRTSINAQSRAAVPHFLGFGRGAVRKKRGAINRAPSCKFPSQFSWINFS